MWIVWLLWWMLWIWSHQPYSIYPFTLYYMMIWCCSEYWNYLKWFIELIFVSLQIHDEALNPFYHFFYKLQYSPLFFLQLIPNSNILHTHKIQRMISMRWKKKVVKNFLCFAFISLAYHVSRLSCFYYDLKWGFSFKFVV